MIEMSASAASPVFTSTSPTARSISMPSMATGSAMRIRGRGVSGMVGCFSLSVASARSTAAGMRTLPDSQRLMVPCSTPRADAIAAWERARAFLAVVNSAASMAMHCASPSSSMQSAYRGSIRRTTRLRLNVEGAGMRRLLHHKSLALGSNPGLGQQLLDHVERLLHIPLADVPQVPDAENLTFELALAAPEDHAKFLTSTLAERFRIHTLWPPHGSDGVRRELFVHRHKLEAKPLDAVAGVIRDRLVARVDPFEALRAQEFKSRIHGVVHRECGCPRILRFGQRVAGAHRIEVKARHFRLGIRCPGPLAHVDKCEAWRCHPTLL